MLNRLAKKTAYSLLNAIPGVFGWQVFAVKKHNPHYHVFDSNMLSAYWNRDEEIAAYETSLHRTGMEWSDNLAKRFRRYSLYQNVNKALDLNLEKGDVAECGVWRGNSAHLIATILVKRRFSNKFLIFDSFQGLSPITERDANELFKLNDKQIAQERQSYACSEDIVRANLSEFDFMEFYPGWIPDRFAEISDRQFIFVHLDVDLYQPTLDSIDFFYPRMPVGAVMAFDDYGSTQYPGAKTAIDEALNRFDPSLFYKIPTGGAFLIK